MAKYNPETHDRVYPYRAAIIAHLQECRVDTADGLEAMILAKFGDKFTREDKAFVEREKKTSKIVRWRNDVHHARRILTQAGTTVTVGDWIAYAPIVGQVFGHTVCDFGAQSTIAAILRILIGSAD